MKMKLKSFKSWDSIRKYLDKQVCEETIKDLIRVSKGKLDLVGDKLFSFTVIQDKNHIKKLNNVTKKDMVKKSEIDIITRLGKTPDFDIFYGAPTVIMICVKDKSRIISDLCGDVIHKIVTYAKELGLSAHWNSFVKYHFTDGEGINDKEELEIPENYTPYYAISIGYSK